MQINHQKGFTLIETLFYTAGMLILLGAIVAFLFYMYDWYQKATIEPRVDRAGIELIDKIVKDIRSGSVTTGGSSFNTDNGVLNFDGYISGAAISRSFALSNGRITYSENGGAVTNISPTGMTVTRLRFAQPSTPISKGIHVDVDINYQTRTGSSTKSFSGFAIMRHSYE